MSFHEAVFMNFTLETIKKKHLAPMQGPVWHCKEEEQRQHSTFKKVVVVSLTLAPLRTKKDSSQKDRITVRNELLL